MGAGGAALLRVPAGPTEISWLSPLSLGLLLLIRVYLRKKDPCQDHHAGRAGHGYARHKTLFAGGGDASGTSKDLGGFLGLWGGTRSKDLVGASRLVKLVEQSIWVKGGQQPAWPEAATEPQGAARGAGHNSGSQQGQDLRE